MRDNDDVEIGEGTSMNWKLVVAGLVVLCSLNAIGAFERTSAALPVLSIFVVIYLLYRSSVARRQKAAEADTEILEKEQALALQREEEEEKQREQLHAELAK